MSEDEARNNIKDYIDTVKNLIPENLLPCHAPSRHSGYAPGKYEFESQIWDIGEKIRQLMLEHQSLRKDKELLDEIVEICIDERAMHGRQSFIMLLGYKHCIKYEDRLITQLFDYTVFGHIIDTLYKMGSTKYEIKINPFTDTQVAWVRKVAMKYVVRSKEIK